MKRRTSHTRWWIGAAALLALGCQGELVSEGPAGPRGSEGCSRGCSERPAPTSRAPRISHEQYENAVRDLLRLDGPTGVSDVFLADAPSGTFDNDGSELSVGGDLWSDYQRAAETLSAQISGDADALARLEPSDAPTDTGGRLEAFVRALGLRAFRRPPTDEEVGRYTALAARAPDLYPELEPFRGGVRLVLEAMLQSPHFLYRVELSTGDDDGSSYPIDPYEIATRLSFALWNGIPDQELLAAAESGELREREVVRAQAVRMLEDDRARAMVRDFHYQWVDLSRYDGIDRSTTLFPEFDPALPASMKEETLRFVESVVFEDGAGLHALLGSPHTFVDARLAAVYGVDAPDGDWARVTFEDGSRAGLFTQSGFLAAQATATESDPIHRGVHINRRVLCADLPAPPMNVPPLPAEDPSVPRTLRQRIELHTGEGTCGARCHGTMINPIGFAFEHYDALGRWQDLDNELPVDATASYVFEGGERSYDGAAELARVMTEEEQTHRCYVGFWLEYLYGRRRQGVDEVLVRRVGRASLDSEAAVRELLIELVTSDAFLRRSADELEDPEEDGS